MLEISLRDLADVHREVSDALEVGADPGGRDERSKIERNGLMQGDQSEASAIDLHLQARRHRNHRQ